MPTVAEESNGLRQYTRSQQYNLIFSQFCKLVNPKIMLVNQ